MQLELLKAIYAPKMCQNQLTVMYTTRGERRLGEAEAIVGEEGNL